MKNRRKFVIKKIAEAKLKLDISKHIKCIENTRLHIITYKHDNIVDKRMISKEFEEMLLIEAGRSIGEKMAKEGCVDVKLNNEHNFYGDNMCKYVFTANVQKIK